MKLRIIYLVCLLASSSVTEAQVIRMLGNDSSRVYYELKLKDRIYNPFSEGSDGTMFNDSSSFYSFLDSVSDMKVLPLIDFDRYQVGLDAYCAQCEANCNHDRYDQNVCHRNACMFTTVYYTQERKRREELNFKMILLPEQFYIRDSEISTEERWKEINKDSAIQIEIDFEKEILLFRNEGGDCHAWFSHEFFLDHVNRRMVWKIFNHYGGCRAGLSKDFLVKAPKPPEGYSVSFERILMD